MSAFEIKTALVDAVQVTRDNKADIASSFGLNISKGELYDSKGTLINPGAWACRFGDGVIKVFTDELFKRLFVKVEPPQYKLSDIPDFNRDIMRKDWGNTYLKNLGYCFVMYNGTEPVQPYQFTDDDFTAEDWIIKED